MCCTKKPAGKYKGKGLNLKVKVFLGCKKENKYPVISNRQKKR